MKNSLATGQVEAQDKAQVTPQDTPLCGGHPEWFGKGGRTFLSADKKHMAGWKTRPPLREMDKTLKTILEKIGV